MENLSGDKVKGPRSITTSTKAIPWQSGLYQGFVVKLKYQVPAVGAVYLP
jgi:hypothetical protein